uniref:Formin binding protein 1a n=1 Tax=Sinocyclocheilus grahami TaxID=75366 RepID=A0A672N8P5_SINGR
QDWYGMDQFDNLEKHTQWGIEFLERYTKFVKERSEIELSYAKQIRNLSKKYQLKKNSKEEEEFNLCLTTVQKFGVCKISVFLKEVSYAQQGFIYLIKNAVKLEYIFFFLFQSKRRFERDCKEADRAQHYFDKMDADINVTKADVEKAKQQAQMRHQIAEDSKNEYLTYLQKFNKDQHEHYYTLIPHIFQRIQEMEERRVGRVRESMRVYTEVEHKVLPIVSKCLDVLRLLLFFYKKLMCIPFNKVCNDFFVMQEFLNIFCALDILSLLIFSLPVFLHSISQCAPSHLHPPTSPSPDGLPNGPQSPQQPKEPLSQRLNGFMGTKHKMHCLRSLKRGGTGQEDYSHLPPEQRRKKLQAKLNDINKDIQKEMDQRDALTKMKDVYIKNPHLGDPDSVDPRLEEITQSLEKLQLEAHKFEYIEGTKSRERNSNCVHVLVHRGNELVNHAHNFFFSLHVMCGAPYECGENVVCIKTETRPFTRNAFLSHFLEGLLSPLHSCLNEGTISMAESEMLYVIEEDKGDGWTRVRKNEDEEGYVPTSYIKLFLDMNAKGAMTYI